MRKSTRTKHTASAGIAARARQRGNATDAARLVILEAEKSGAPADRLLRDFLRERGLAGGDAGDVARAVFAWFRWRGLLERFAPDARGIGRALAFDERFARNPDRFDPAVLAARAVPDWTAGEVDVSIEWIQSLQAPPVLWLRARPGGAAALSGLLPGARPAGNDFLPEAVRFEGQVDLYHSAPFREGLFEIQDIASQAVGRVCAPGLAQTWWDVCAGEGGKTLHLSDLMGNRGLIRATDRSARRVEMLKRRAARAGAFNYRVDVWDDPARPPFKTRFDGVLVDAPCSGLGTWGRNPHARWTTTPQDVVELAAVQKNLLAVAAGSLKPGGRLVYAVCTLTRSETTAVADAFETQHPGFEPLAFSNPFVPDAELVARQVWWPRTTGGNGMFVAMWRAVSV